MESSPDTYLAVVGAVVLGHSALTVHQEAVPAALLRQGRLVSLRNESVQLSLLTADGLDKLRGGGGKDEQINMRRSSFDNDNTRRFIQHTVYLYKQIQEFHLFW